MERGQRSVDGKEARKSEKEREREGERESGWEYGRERRRDERARGEDIGAGDHGTVEPSSLASGPV